MAQRIRRLPTEQKIQSSNLCGGSRTLIFSFAFLWVRMPRSEEHSSPLFTCDPSPAVLAIGGSRRVRLPQGGPHRPCCISVGVRRSAPTADDDARGAAGWPRGEICHVAHGALLRARLRHRVRTHEPLTLLKPHRAP